MFTTDNVSTLCEPELVDRPIREIRTLTEAPVIERVCIDRRKSILANGTAEDDIDNTRPLLV